MSGMEAKFALLERLRRENEEVQAEIDKLISEMERVPAVQRSQAEWGPKGTLTRRFLELSERQNEIAAEVKRVSQEIEQDAPSKKAN